MPAVLQKFYDGYNYVFEDLADPRVKSYFLMSSPFPLLCMLGFYLYFVLKLGPRFMKNRPPFDLEKALVVYNLVQILACLYLVIQVCRYTLTRYSFACEPVDYSNDEVALTAARHTWLYFMLKITDLLDTVFFVLRKKNNQVSFLHVYHHTLMCILGWTATTYIAGGHTVFFGLVNCAVHAVMYFYYLLSAWDKEYKKNVWWKKHITHLQLTQFVTLFLHFGLTLLQPNCGYPKWAAWLCVTQSIVMITLFLNFYIKAYVKPQEKRKMEHRNCSSTGKNALNNHRKKFK